MKLLKEKKHKRTCEEKAEREHLERTFGGSKKVDSVEKTVKKCEQLECKKKEEDNRVKTEVEAAELKKKEEEVAEHKKKQEGKQRVKQA